MEAKLSVDHCLSASLVKPTTGVKRMKCGLPSSFVCIAATNAVSFAASRPRFPASLLLNKHHQSSHAHPVDEVLLVVTWFATAYVCEPCCFIARPQLTFEFQSTHRIFTLRHEMDRQKPDRQGQLGVLKYSVSNR